MFHRLWSFDLLDSICKFNCFQFLPLTDHFFSLHKSETGFHYKSYNDFTPERTFPTASKTRLIHNLLATLTPSIPFLFTIHLFLSGEEEASLYFPFTLSVNSPLDSFNIFPNNNNHLWKSRNVGAEDQWPSKDHYADVNVFRPKNNRGHEFLAMLASSFSKWVSFSYLVRRTRIFFTFDFKLKGFLKFSSFFVYPSIFLCFHS